MQDKVPFETLCAFLKAQQHEQQAKADKVREQLDQAVGQKVYEQEARIDRLSFAVFVLSVLCVCQFLYMLTL